MSNPANQPPYGDGDVKYFFPDQLPYRSGTQFYYVNGIKTTPAGHQAIAELIANITESTVCGIYNLTNGMAADLKQCLGDWVRIVSNQIGEEGFFRDRLSQSAINALASVSIPARLSAPWLHAMRDAFIAPVEIMAGSKSDEKIRAALKRNEASYSLYDELTKRLGASQIVVAHSQGNLITSFALWGIQAVYGSQGLANIQVRSISSPSPAWPRGINHQIKVYGQSDDPVTWADPKNLTGNRSAGDWSQFRSKSPIEYLKSGGIAAHDADYNINQTNLYRRLRADAGITPF
jgi:hypothetical protein